MPNLHARFGGSTIARTINCPAWRKLADQCPPQKESEYADRGTLLHECMEYILLEDKTPQDCLGRTYKSHVVTQDMIEDKIKPALAAVDTIFKDYGVTDYTVEEKVVLFDDAWGTADLLARGESKKGITYGLCLDFKFGDGIVVQAENNQQGLFYSLAASRTEETADLFEDVDVVVIGIIQPTSHSDEDYSLWDVDPKELDDMYVRVSNALIEAKSDDPGLPCPGSHCAFCPAEAICPAKTGELQALARLDVTNPEVIKNLPSYEEIAQIESTIKAIKKLVHEQLEEGVNIPGFKLVNKRASRVYNDQEAVEDVIRRSKKLKKDDAYDFKVKSPAQLEKVCKSKGVDFKKTFGEFISSVSSGTTLASENDKREAVIPGAALQQLASKL